MPEPGTMYEPFYPVAIRPLGGMVLSVPADAIPLGASPDMLNCAVVSGKLVKRPGYTTFGTGQPLDSYVTGIFSTQNTENSTLLIAVTNLDAYVYNTTTGAWDALTGGPLSGGVNPVQFENSQNSVVWSNGVYAVQVASISSIPVSYAALDANCPPARFMTRFVNRLLLGHTVESGDTKPFRIRRSVSGDHTDWTGIGSGFNDVDEFPYHLRGIRKLASQMAVYTEKSIHLATPTGIAASPYQVQLRTEGVGLYIERSLKHLPGVGHMFVGNDNIYTFNGVNEAPVGNPIRDLLFQNLSVNSLRNGFAELTEDTQEYLLFVSTGGNSYADTIWVFNWGLGIWYRWTGRNQFCGTRHRNDASTTFDDLVGTIDEQTYEFDSRELLAAFPLLLTGNASGAVHVWGTQYATDNGTLIPCRWTSKDFTSQQLDPSRVPCNLTCREIAVEYESSGVDTDIEFSYSSDGGTTWDGPYTVTLVGGTGTIKTAYLTQQFTGPRIRFKFEHEHATQTFRIIAFTPTFEIREPIVP